MRRRTLLCLGRGGLLLVSVLLAHTVTAQEQEKLRSVVCPSLPDQGQTEAVAVFVAQALDAPGVVCLRVRNTLQVHIAGEIYFQRWEKGWFWGGQFRNVESYPRRGGALMPVGAALLLPPGEGIALPLPVSGQPAAPGRYRVCWRYRTPAQEQEQEVCSAEFDLP